jgi:hypothetical protein
LRECNAPNALFLAFDFNHSPRPNLDLVELSPETAVVGGSMPAERICRAETLDPGTR